MVIKHGNMWEDSKADSVLFTGNATIRHDGCLVMGRGAAMQAQVRYPGCNKVFGKLVHESKSPYGVLWHPDMRDPMLGVFQVKGLYSEKAGVELIAYSTSMLKPLALLLKHRLYAVNFPGIGYGGLSESEVLPIIQCLPDNVEVWKY